MARDRDDERPEMGGSRTGRLPGLSNPNIARGDRVALTYDRGRHGRVVGAGPEQSVVKWPGTKGEQAHSNRHLVRVVIRARSRREK